MLLPPPSLFWVALGPWKPEAVLILFPLASWGNADPACCCCCGAWLDCLTEAKCDVDDALVPPLPPR
uniref:Putative secreted peptide n=1 Tax=Anopheles braziliensis TaxID=58242 RepID=A0A2M3ZSW4_9DIPT